VAGISGCRTARQRRALPDARGRYAARDRVSATVTGGRRFVVTVLSGANDVGATAPGQRAGDRVRVVLDLQTRVVVVVVVVVVRRTFGRRPRGRQVGGLLPDQSGRRQVPGRPRSTDGAVLVTAAPAAATAAAAPAVDTGANRNMVSVPGDLSLVYPHAAAAAAWNFNVFHRGNHRPHPV